MDKTQNVMELLKVYNQEHVINLLEKVIRINLLHLIV